MEEKTSLPFRARRYSARTQTWLLFCFVFLNLILFSHFACLFNLKRSNSQWALTRYEFKKIPNGSDLYEWVQFIVENWYKLLKKNFPWKFLQKLLKSINFCIYLQIDLKDILVSKFWLKIYIPGEISNHLIGHTIYFHGKIRFSFFMPPLQRTYIWRN